jgi:UPF0271 protein
VTQYEAHSDRPAAGPAARSIDLNCDMGEMPDLIADGTQEALMLHVSSVNVACGGHAGDEAMMEATIRAALARGRAIGAHPSYPDRENFGRKAMAMPPEEVSRTVREQIARLQAVAARCGASLAHVKPHGALYNQAAHDETLARAVAEGVARFEAGLPGATLPGPGLLGCDLLLVGLAGSPALAIYARAGFRVLAEAFADRRYEADGRLRSRTLPGSLLTDPGEAAAQALAIARDGIVTAFDRSTVRLQADTLCIHGDTPGAPRIAAAVASRLRDAGFAIAPPDIRTKGIRPRSITP